MANQNSWKISMSEGQRAIVAAALVAHAKTLGVADKRPEFDGTELDELVVLRDLFVDLPVGGSDPTDSRDMIYGFNL